jgi:hypothetical protein
MEKVIGEREFESNIEKVEKKCKERRRVNIPSYDIKSYAEREREREREREEGTRRS